MLKDIKIDNNSDIPKYKQLADAIIQYIDFDKPNLNEKLPSVHNFAKELDVSRETVFRALNIVSEKGIIKSTNRKGYFIQKTNIQIDYRVFFMLDKMTSFKEEIYDTLRKELGGKSEIEIYFHHNNKKVFKSLIEQNINSYSHFVISTFFDEDVSEILNLIPEGKLIIIDQKEPNIKIKHSQIFQDFENDIYEMLSEAQERISVYNRICLVAPSTAPHRNAILKGFDKFCKEKDTTNFVLEHNKLQTVQNGVVYILIGFKNDDLVKIIKYCREQNYQLGKEIGVISYNETQLKEILEGGITVISTDFKQMGTRVAQVIKNNEQVIERNPSRIIVRNSL